MLVGEACVRSLECGPQQICQKGVCICSSAFAMRGSHCTVPTITTAIGAAVAVIIAGLYFALAVVAVQQGLPLLRRLLRAYGRRIAPGIAIQPMSSQVQLLSGDPLSGGDAAMVVPKTRKHRPAASLAPFRAASPSLLGLLTGMLTSLLYALAPFHNTAAVRAALLLFSCLTTAAEAVVALRTTYSMLQMGLLIKLLRQRKARGIFLLAIVVLAVTEGASMTVRALSHLPLQVEFEVAAAMFSLLCRYLSILCPALPVIRGLKHNYNMESLRLKSLGEEENKSWRGRFVYKAYSRLLRLIKTISASALMSAALSIPYFIVPQTYPVQVPLACMAAHGLICHIEIMRLRGYRLPLLFSGACGGIDAVNSSTNDASKPQQEIGRIRSHAMAVQGEATECGRNVLSVASGPGAEGSIQGSTHESSCGSGGVNLGADALGLRRQRPSSSSSNAMINNYGQTQRCSLPVNLPAELSTTSNGAGPDDKGRGTFSSEPGTKPQPLINKPQTPASSSPKARLVISSSSSEQNLGTRQESALGGGVDDSDEDFSVTSSSSVDEEDMPSHDALTLLRAGLSDVEAGL